jgi:gliding motility-associated-like protein
MKFFLCFFIAFVSHTETMAQCVVLGDLNGSLTDPVTGLVIDYAVTLSPTQSFQNLSGGTYCGITFPAVATPFSGLNGSAPNTITYTFSQPILSIDVIIAYIGVINTSTATEVFTFTTNSAIPSLTVNSGTCDQMNVNGNQSDNLGIFGALNAIHTVSSTTPFTTLSITTISSGVTLPGIIGNGGSSYALCDNSIVGFCPPPQINLGSDTVICNNGTLLLSAEIDNGSYLWQDGSTNSTYSVDSPGLYFVQATNTCGVVSDSIVVQFNQTPFFSLGQDTVICQGVGFTIDLSSNMQNYLWQDGSTESFFAIEKSGLYWVQASNGCGTFTDSIIVTFFDNPEIILDYSAACSGYTVSFDLSVDWNGGLPNLGLIAYGDGTSGTFSELTFSYPGAGTYNAVFTATTLEGCTQIDSIQISLSLPPSATITSNSFCFSVVDFQSNVLLDDKSLSIVQHFWIVADDSVLQINPSVEFNQPSGTYSGIYGIVLSNNCVYEFDFDYFLDDQLNVDLVSLPNVITPNSDGVNDIFLIDETLDKCAAYVIEFLNRWGQVVYVMTSNQQPFEGRDSGGSLLVDGVYFYRFTSEKISEQGFVSVLR